MRVLSPKIDPPEILEEGSIASTATRCPLSIKYRPRVSIKVDLPTPGTPDIPRRKDLPVLGNKVLSTSSARLRWSMRVDSSRVMILAKARRCGDELLLVRSFTKAWSTALSMLIYP